MKKVRKLIDVSESTVKVISKMAIDKNTTFKPFVEKIIEDTGFSESIEDLVVSVNKYRKFHMYPSIDDPFTRFFNGRPYVIESALCIQSGSHFGSPFCFTIRRMLPCENNLFFIQNGTGWASKEFIETLIKDGEFFSSSMPNISVPTKGDRISETYMSFDKRTGFTKIGKSIDYKKRENTLQAEKPDFSIFAVCKNNVEGAIHKEFYTKRKRGEWFLLTTNDLIGIIASYGFIIVNQDSFNAILSLGIDLKDLGK
jgi:hypothetical protein